MTLETRRIAGIAVFCALAVAGSALAASTRYVDARANAGGDGASWGTAYRYLQDALVEASGAGGTIGEIRVAEGTYRPDQGAGRTAGDKTAVFALVDGVALRGGYAGLGSPDPDARDVTSYPTVLSGDLAGDDRFYFENRADNAMGIMVAEGVGASTLVEGVTIEGVGAINTMDASGQAVRILGASPRFLQCTIRSHWGQAVYAKNSQPVFEDTGFYDNVSSSRPAAIEASSSEISLLRSAFIGNRIQAYSSTAEGTIQVVGGRLHMEDCVFRHNGTPTTGVIFSTGVVVALRCIFTEQLGRCISQSPNWSSRFEHCVFLDNLNTTLSLGQGQPVIVGCGFYRNRSAGSVVHVDKSGTPVFTGCVFQDNESRSTSQGVVNVSNAAFTNCVFAGNQAAGYGALRAYGNTRIDNCTFHANSSAAEGGGVYAYTDAGSPNAVLTMRNSILWGNSVAGVVSQSAQIRTVSVQTDLSRNNVQKWDGSLGGVGNMAVDPGFLHADASIPPVSSPIDNLRLAAGSPCIDAGDPALLPSDQADLDGDGDAAEPLPLDLDGLPRMAGAGPDLGAYEGVRPRLLIEPAALEIPEGGTAELWIRPADAPAAELVIETEIVAGDPDIELTSGGRLVFTSGNYATAQPVSLTAGADQDRLDGTVVLRIRANGVIAAEASVREVDADHWRVLYVNPAAGGPADGLTWATAFRTVATALQMARDLRCGADEVWVAAGIYTPVFETDFGWCIYGPTFALADGVRLYGGFSGDETTRDQADPVANETVLSAAGGLRPSGTVVLCEGANVVEGFTVTGGRLTTATTTWGGGIQTLAQANIRRCILRGNTADYGSGIAVLSGDATISECVFERNGQYWTRGAGGALWCGETARRVEVYNSHFRGNTAMSCFCIERNCEVLLANCVFVGNRYGLYGALIDHQWASKSSLRMANCSLVENQGQTVLRAGSTPRNELENSILWNNRSDSGALLSSPFNLGGSNYLIRNCCILGWPSGYVGEQVIWTDPQFRRNPSSGSDGWGVGNNDDYGDLRLTYVSPCVDAGRNEAVPPDGADLDGDGDFSEPLPLDLGGRARIIPGRNTTPGAPHVVDMGSYEYYLDPAVDDRDGDGIHDAVDNCPQTPNADQANLDGDGLGDACDDDMDGDGRLNTADNCPRAINPLQEDADNDGLGDACDNCPQQPNADQADADGDTIGDVCDEDRDGDGRPNTTDNCPTTANPGQEDADADGVGNACDGCPDTPAGRVVDANGCPRPVPGDFDDDGDVDQEDFGRFQVCLNQAGIAPPVGCSQARMDGDNDVDPEDLAIFAGCISGPGVMGNPDCAAR